MKVSSLPTIVPGLDWLSRVFAKLRQQRTSRTEELRRWMAELEETNTKLAQEVSERKRVEKELRQAEAKYRSIFENAVDGIFQTTPEGQYISVNPALACIYGYENPEALMANLTDIGGQLYVDASRRAEFVSLLHKYRTVTGFESQVYRRDGKIIWITETARAVQDASGALLYYEGIVEDISQRKRAEEELQKAKSGLELNFLRGLESNLGKANQLLDGAVFYGNPGQFSVDYQKTLAVTGADVKRVASSYLSRSRIVLSVVPKGKKDQASKAAESETVTMVNKQSRGGRS